MHEGRVNNTNLIILQHALHFVSLQKVHKRKVKGTCLKNIHSFSVNCVKYFPIALKHKLRKSV